MMVKERMFERDKLISFAFNAFSGKRLRHDRPGRNPSVDEGLNDLLAALPYVGARNDSDWNLWLLPPVNVGEKEKSVSLRDFHRIDPRINDSPVVTGINRLSRHT